MIPLAAFTSYGPGNTALAVNHQSSFVASTISFNLAPGKSLSDATTAVNQAGAAIVNEFLKHNPSAATQAGLMHDAVTGKLKPLIKDLQGIGDTSSAALVSSIQTNAAKGNWDAVGKSIERSVQTCVGYTKGCPTEKRDLRYIGN